MAPRVVLDTNIVLSALLFTAGRLTWVRQAWQRNQVQPLICGTTARELIRVLAYPKFGLSETEREALLADILPYAEVVTLPDPWPALPRCRDPQDQVFLALGEVGAADALVTGDADLLALSGQLSRPIMAPETFKQWLRAWRQP